MSFRPKPTGEQTEWSWATNIAIAFVVVNDQGVITYANHVWNDIMGLRTNGRPFRKFVDVGTPFNGYCWSRNRKWLYLTANRVGALHSTIVTASDHSTLKREVDEARSALLACYRSLCLVVATVRLSLHLWTSRSAHLL